MFFFYINYLQCFLVIYISGWFGMRQNFCEFLLGLCPCLQEYGNVSCKFPESIFVERQEGSSEDIHRKPVVPEHQTKPVVPIVSIEMPD
jgi:hypothetical protein